MLKTELYIKNNWFKSKVPSINFYNEGIHKTVLLAEYDIVNVLEF